MSDNLIWHCDGSGSYSVKSDYRLLREDVSTTIGRNSNNHACMVKRFYSELWSMSFPAKVLDAQGVQLPAPSTGEDWLVSTFCSLNEMHRRALLVTFWATWYARNKLVHEDSDPSPHITLAFVEAFLRETMAIKPVVYLTATADRVCWQAPMESMVKVNFDATFDVQSKSSTSGVLCRNDEGLIMLAYTLHHVHVSDAFMAEALSCLQAVILARDLGFSKIVVEGDSLTVIKKLCSVAADTSTIIPVIYDIRVVA
ncbi:hypothetical protein V6N11_013014 [Hibiscus sabdariffa]|uniref:RNase H type-1 domain-containing protein n=2 Tax=Hibiscus sabdariffa TaxID=183260 RepID=A0ABR2ADI1_9ROSI